MDSIFLEEISCLKEFIRDNILKIVNLSINWGHLLIKSGVNT